MLPVQELVRRAIVSLAILAAGVAAGQGQTTQDRFYQAYYLEHADGDIAAAAELYGQVAQARNVDPELQASAQARLAVCREELATADFTRLMPPEPLAYLELNRPGERLRKLIDQLGLLADAGSVPTPGQNRLAISPALIDAVLGMRGLCVAVTGFDPASEQPAGVAILHPGDMELIRGLIETALPAAALVVEPIGGYPTYQIEQFHVTLTKRLVVAGSSRMEIQGVLERMRDPHAESLAENADLAPILRERNEAMLFFCVNPKPLMPLIDMMMGSASQSREVALARALLDPSSFQSLAGRFDISDQGLVLELTLRLDEGHRNLVYNFFRRPALDPQTLRCVPAGAAGFLALAMNEAPADYAQTLAAEGSQQPIVTALDLGRELFANINGIAICVLPPTPGVPRPAGMPIPDVVAVITVNDPSQSLAIWNQFLGIASVAAGAPTMDGKTREIAGVPVRSYHFEAGGVTVHVAADGHDLMIATTTAALERCIAAKREGHSILADDAFAYPLSQLDASTTFAVVVHPARCAAVARPFMSAADVAEMDPVLALLKDTTALVKVDHSDRTLRLATAVSGVPDVSGLVNQMLTEQHRRARLQGEIKQALRGKNWHEALRLVDEQLSAAPGDLEALRSKFNILAVQVKDRDAAARLAEELFAALKDSATSLNDFAWALLTEDQYGQEYNDMALRFARRSNELTGESNWAYVDTLALAEFEAGDTARAVELEEKAIELSRERGGPGMDALEKALARFREGGGER